MRQNDLLIRNENIQRLFDWYLKGDFIVNRKYQRKLVWTIEEKQQFINSILSDYPVPLFLLAITSESRYEIIDGMQRLNAIFAFIKGEYSVNFNGQEGYFDLQTMAVTKELMDTGMYIQKAPLLLVFTLSSGNAPIAYDNKFYERHATSVEEIIGATGLADLFSRFK